jgi:hypothetical protein
MFFIAKPLLVIGERKSAMALRGVGAHNILTFAHNLIIVAAGGVYVCVCVCVCVCACGEVLRRRRQYLLPRVFGFN